MEVPVNETQDSKTHWGKNDLSFKQEIIEIIPYITGRDEGYVFRPEITLAEKKRQTV